MKNIWVLSAVGGGLYLWGKYAEPIAEAIWTVAWAMHAVVEPTYNTWMNVLSQVPYVWEAAPFAFPVVGWAALGYKAAEKLGTYKLWQALWFDTKIWKGILSIVWWWAWYVASQSVLAPYLGLYWLYKTGKIAYDKQIPQRLLNWVVNPLMKVAEGTKKLAIDPFIAAKKWFIDNQFEKPNISY